MRILLSATTAMLLAWTPIRAGPWGPAGCAAGPAVQTQPTALTYRWRAPTVTFDQWVLYRDGRQIGNWSPAWGVYRPWDGRAWGEVCDPPYPLPVEARPPIPLQDEREPEFEAVAGDEPPCGVVQSKLSGRNRLLHGGQEIDPKAFFGGGPLPLPDDRKPYLAIVGDEDFQRRAKSALTAARLAERFTIGCWAPMDWQVAGVGLGCQGIHALAPRRLDGTAREIHYQADLEGIDTMLAAVLAAADAEPVDTSPGPLLRLPRPDFDPLKVPDLRRPKPAPQPQPQPAPMPSPSPQPVPLPAVNSIWLFVLAAIAGLILWLRKGN